MFPALSRVQNDPPRLRSYFLKGYSFFLALVTPLTLVCGLFAEDLVLVFLGPKWSGAAPVFRLLAPTIVVFALINPLAWLMLACGLARRSLNIAFMIAPVVVLGYVLGLGHGPQGVAIGYSSAMLALALPVIIWATHGTPITTKDILRSAVKPLVATLCGAASVLLCWGWIVHIKLPVVRLAVELTLMFGVYLATLLFALNQKVVYLDLFRASGLWPLRRKTNETK
jgi:PST family polysaccharide transporter